MKIDVTTIITDLEGKAVMVNLVEKIEMTVKNAFVESLMGTYKDETIDGFEKYNRFKLADKIGKATDSVNLSSVDVVLIKKLVGKAWSTLVVGRVFEMFEKLEKKQ